MSAQDDSRENKQKTIFGFGDHKRGEKYDFKSKDTFGELKTKKTGAGCSTKRRFTKNTLLEWKNTEFIISEYNPKNPKELTGVHYYLPKGSLDKWLKSQSKKLQEGTKSRLGYDDVSYLAKFIKDNITDDERSKINSILELCYKNVHLNCPMIPNGYIKENAILLKEENFEKQKNYLKENK